MIVILGQTPDAAAGCGSLGGCLPVLRKLPLHRAIEIIDAGLSQFDLSGQHTCGPAGSLRLALQGGKRGFGFFQASGKALDLVALLFHSGANITNRTFLHFPYGCCHIASRLGCGLERCLEASAQCRIQCEGNGNFTPHCYPRSVLQRFQNRLQIPLAAFPEARSVANGYSGPGKELPGADHSVRARRHRVFLFLIVRRSFHPVQIIKRSPDSGIIPPVHLADFVIWESGNAGDKAHFHSQMILALFQLERSLQGVFLIAYCGAAHFQFGQRLASDFQRLCQLDDFFIFHASFLYTFMPVWLRTCCSKSVPSTR